MGSSLVFFWLLHGGTVKRKKKDLFSFYKFIYLFILFNIVLQFLFIVRFSILLFSLRVLTVPCRVYIWNFGGSYWNSHSKRWFLFVWLLLSCYLFLFILFLYFIFVFPFWVLFIVKRNKRWMLFIKDI